MDDNVNVKTITDREVIVLEENAYKILLDEPAIYDYINPCQPNTTIAEIIASHNLEKEYNEEDNGKKEEDKETKRTESVEKEYVNIESINNNLKKDSFLTFNINNIKKLIDNRL